MEGFDEIWTSTLRHMNTLFGRLVPAGPSSMEFMEFDFVQRNLIATEYKVGFSTDKNMNPL